MISTVLTPRREHIILDLHYAQVVIRSRSVAVHCVGGVDEDAVDRNLFAKFAVVQIILVNVSEKRFGIFHRLTTMTR